MKKQTKTIFGKKNYLLGIDSKGIKYWLEAPSWDCDWYWGFGYVQTFTNNKCPEKSVDLNSLSHFDYLFLKNTRDGYNQFTSFFKDTTLSKEEIWLLLDWMSVYYTLRKTAEIYHSGNSHYTSRALVNELKLEDWEKKINQEQLPALFAVIDNMFTSDN